MPKEKLFLVVNPKAGMAKMKNELLKVVTVFARAGYEVSVYPTAGKGDAIRAVIEMPADIGTVVCCGGDGTLNEVITGIINGKHSCRVGYIPCGTLNEWSSGLHISRNIEQAAKDIVTGRVEALDIGLFNDHYFAYTASFGAFTSASYSANQDVKNVLGQAAYVFEGIKSLANIKPIHMRVQTETKKVEGNYLFGAVSNSLSVGGIIKLDKAKVELNDGLFEMLLIENPENIAEFNDIVDGILKRDFTRRRIIQMKANRITVKTDKVVSWTLDGEYAKGKLNTVIENLPQAVQFIIPAK